MEELQLELLFERYGVPYATLSISESKRRLLEKLLERAAKLKDGTDRIFALTYLKMLREHSMPDVEIDPLLETLIYEVSPKSFDPPRQPRRREDKLVIRSQMARTIKRNRYGVSAAAKAIHPRWKEVYRSYKSLASRYHQIGQELSEQQVKRDQIYNERLLALFLRFCHNEDAMSSWASLCRRTRQYNLALLRGEFHMARYVLKGIDDLFDRLLDSGDPFGTSFVLCCSDMPVSYLVENHLGPLLETLQQADKRSELFAEMNLPELGERESVNKVLGLLEAHDYLPGKSRAQS